MIGTLKDIGWEPISPYKWRAPDTSIWAYKHGEEVTISPIYHKSKECLEHNIFVEAAKHRNGAGIQMGIDFTVPNQLRKHYLKIKDFASLNLLHTILAGGIYTPARKVHEHIADDAKCEMCEHAQCDEYHMYYGCKCLTKDPKVPTYKNTQGDICELASANHETVPCLFYRGLMPSSITVPPIPENDTINLIGDHLVPICDYKYIFLDGSGGPNLTAKDWRLRRVGWAWVAFTHDHEEVYGAYGGMEGPQTVPRAETHALLMALKKIHGTTFVPDESSQKCITIYTDCKGVLQNWNKGRILSCKTMNGDIWSDIWETYDLIPGDINISIHKLKSHVKDEDLHKHSMTPFQKLGNERADKLAALGAESVQLTREIINKTMDQDMLCHTIIKRLIYVTQQYHKKHDGVQDKETESQLLVLPPTRAYKLNELGHKIDMFGRKAHCINCGMSWAPGNIQGALDRKQICPIIQRIGAPNYANLVQHISPYKMSHEIYFAGQCVHPSHSLHWHNGYLFCVACGRYARNKVSKLKSHCPGQISPAGKKIIREILFQINED